MDDFQDLKQFYFDLGVEFKQFVIEYSIKHNLILNKKKAINIILKQKSFVYLLSEKPDEELIHSNDAPTMINEEEKDDIANVRINRRMRQYKQKEIIYDLKEQMEANNKEQQ